MRPAIILGVIISILPGAANAQSGPYLATITDNVPIRATPSSQYKDTGTLKKGALVVVKEVANGWATIELPPGGPIYWTNWVHSAFLDEGFDRNKPAPQNVVVEEDTSLPAGELGFAQPILEIQRTRVPQGTILTIIGGPVSFASKTWYPVAPPKGDYRYIPQQYVRYEQPANTSFTVRESPGPGSVAVGPAILPASSSIPAASVPAVPSVPGAPATSSANPAIRPQAGKPSVQHPLWAQAQAAEKEGRTDDAEKLYFQLAREMNEPGGDRDIANMCYTRIHSLREKKRTTPVSTSTSAPRPSSTETVRSAPGPSASASRPLPEAAVPGDGDESPRWYGPGKLVKTYIVSYGQTLYALESNPGVLVVYVAAGPNVDLEGSVNHRVRVHGSLTSRRDLSKPYVVATDIQKAQ
jgi:hypothetical protein